MVSLGVGPAFGAFSPPTFGGLVIGPIAWAFSPLILGGVLGGTIWPPAFFLSSTDFDLLFLDLAGVCVVAVLLMIEVGSFSPSGQVRSVCIETDTVGGFGRTTPA